MYVLAALPCVLLLISLRFEVKITYYIELFIIYIYYYTGNYYLTVINL